MLRVFPKMNNVEQQNYLFAINIKSILFIVSSTTSDLFRKVAQGCWMFHEVKAEIHTERMMLPKLWTIRRGEP